MKVPLQLSEISHYAESVAYPTIGIILLGGVSDKIHRNPLHTSAGIAYTGNDDKIEVRTTVYTGKGEPHGDINGAPVEFTESSRSPFYVLSKYREYVARNLSIDAHGMSMSFSSVNTGVLSGSSDAGAAAIGVSIQKLAGGTIPKTDLETDLRAISESAARSLYGGLSITWVDSGKIWTERLLGKENFRDIVILGCRFNTLRKPSDSIHENIIKSPDYAGRIRKTAEKGKTLMKLAEGSDVEEIFDLAHNDTDEYHRLIESVGVHVITPEMRRLMNRVNEIRRNQWISYIVTGGSNVFVIVHRSEMQSVIDQISGLYDSLNILKVAGEASVVASGSRN